MNSKIKIYNQLNQNECGICCIAMLSSYYDLIKPLNYYRRIFNVGRDGMSIKNMVEIFKKLSFEVNVYKISIEEISQDFLPAIAFVSSKHFIIIEKITKKNKFILIDSARGKYVESKEKLSEYFSNIIIRIRPNNSFKPDIEKEHVWSNYKQIVKNQKKVFSKVICISFLVYLFTLFIPIAIQKIIDFTLNDPDVIIDNYYYVLAIPLVSMVLFLLLSLIQNKLIIKLGSSMDININDKVMEHLMKLPYSYFETRGLGEIVYRLNLVSNMRTLLTNGVISSLINSGSLVFILIYIFFKSKATFIISLLLLVVIFYYIRYMNKRILAANQDELEADSKVSGVKVETISSIFTIKAMGLENDMLDSFKLAFNYAMKKFKKREFLSKVNSSILNTIQLFSPFILMLLSIPLVIKNVTTYGSLFAMYTLTGLLLSNSIQLFQGYSNFYLMKNTLNRLNDILDEPVADRSGKIKIDEINSIEFKNVNFSYSDNSSYGLKDISFKINKSEKIAFVGETGSGKSTIIKLIASLDDCNSGEILVNDINIKNIDFNDLREKIGIIPQNVKLFNRSIFNNIKLNSNVSKNDVNEALKFACLDKDVENMPLKLETIVSDLGQNFSGGQIQRIAIARAIIHKPQLLVLDEATSSLDNLVEDVVNNNIDKLKCTKVISAHRLSTIIDADKIFVVNNGTIVEEGTHKDLIERKGIYYSLYRKQLPNNNTKVLKGLEEIHA